MYFCVFCIVFIHVYMSVGVHGWVNVYRAHLAVAGGYTGYFLWCLSALFIEARFPT